MGRSVEYLVSKSGQVCVPAEVRRRWHLMEGGRVTVVDLGDAVVLLPPGARQRLVREALSSKEHEEFVRSLEDPDLATT